jgi:hypothetical protein
MVYTGVNSMSVTIEIKRGNSSSVSSGLSIEEAGSIIRGLAGEPDATVTVSKADAPDGQVMLAVTGTRFFLGLFSLHDEVYQYIAHGNERHQGKLLFTIGGLPTHIESRYVVDVKTADAVIREWLTAGRESSSFGEWKLM